MDQTKEGGLDDVLPFPNEHRRRRLRPQLPDGDVDCVIRQATLERVFLLQNKIKADAEELESMRDLRAVMLELGFPVEPGVHSAKIVRVQVPAKKVRGYSYSYPQVK